MAEAPAVIDLFAGAGGLSVGVASSGASLRLMVDNDEDSCRTARLNHDEGVAVLNRDVSLLTAEELRAKAGLDGGPLVLVGGAPCQPFSKAAYWVEAGNEAKYRRERASGLFPLKPAPLEEARPDDRRSLVQEYWRLLLDLDADGFVFENVPSILHPRNKPVLDELIAAATAVGFRVRLVRATAANFGVPQRRERVFVLGSRHSTPAEPLATHNEAGDGGLSPYVTCAEALAPFRSRDFWEPQEEVQGRWAQHLHEVPPGWNYKWHTAWAGHPKPTFETETRFWNFLLKLDPDKPSWTLPASPGPWVGPFHWESRRLRTAEYAAIQGFPLGYRFHGERRSVIRQIGNAVPPAMGAAMVGAVVATITAASARAEVLTA